MVGFTWFHALLIALIGPTMSLREFPGRALEHDGAAVALSTAGACVVAGFAVLAGFGRIGRIGRAAAVGAGLMTASALLVHLSGGYIELHFHFFVMIIFMALYQDWIPYLLALLYVAIHHGVVGVLWPTMVYNHQAAIQAPWTWAGIHAFFVLWASVGSIVAWKYAEHAHGRARLLLECAGEGIFGLNQDGNVMFINSAATRMLGLDGAAAMGQPISRLVRHTRADGSSYSAGESPILGPLQRATSCSVSDERFWRSDGTSFVVDLRCSPIVEHGVVTGVVVTFNDVTERQKAEQAIRAGEADRKTSLSLLSATVESTADGILVVNQAGRIIHYNRKFMTMWRIPQAVMTSGDDDQAIRCVLDQLQDPGAFIKKVKELYNAPEAESHDVLTFKDGRVFERYSKPQRIDGRSVGRVWSFRDITERVRVEAELEKQAMRDALTELYNRRCFSERALQELTRAERHGHSVAVVLADLDRFKAINDTRGHDTGDSVLQAVARSLLNASRGTDLVFRWGGDEFVIVFSQTSRDGLLIAAERIRDAVRTVAKDTSLDFDLSVGIALYPEHGRTVDALVRVADRALYLAKKSGDHIKIGEEDYQLTDDAVKVVFQPVFALQRQKNGFSRREVGYEALSRDPLGRRTVAELFAKYQQIGKLEELKRLCFTTQLNRARDLGLARVFLNVEFGLLTHWNQPPPKPSGIDVILEISELEVLADVDQRLQVALKWRAQGYKFALDDFGAGYISLPFIARFMPEYIKIDRSAILHSVTSPQFKEFMVGLIAALRNYATEGIVGEGVETENELRVTTELGIQLVQGVLFGEPRELMTAPNRPGRRQQSL
jgi:diguanylate cyclase (GGDEF)-like protein/PAS domain S-box-containing protein